jgi:tRNA (guanine37-N1)-methyltransferase
MQKKTIKVLKKKAQKTISDLLDKKIIDSDYFITNEDDYIYIPIKDHCVSLFSKKQIITKDLKKKKKKIRNFKQLLNIPKEDLKKINRSYDIIGDIVVIGIEDGLDKYYNKIGKAIMKVHPQINVVLRKIEHEGVYRTQVLKHVSGENRTETTIKENNLNIRIDVEKVFCSTRLSSERKRIANLVKEEDVCVFFAGAGPFCLCIAKNNKLVRKVYGIELNPVAVKYFKENIKINKLENKVVCVLGDVSVVYKKYKNKFDRIIMPHPTCSEDFLKHALYCLKKNGFIHFYKFVKKDNAFKESEEIINKHINNKKIENKKILLSYSPSVVEVVYDIRIK